MRKENTVCRLMCFGEENVETALENQNGVARVQDQNVQRWIK